MAQHDMNIANQGFPATRADLNNALQALATNNSGTSAPSTTFANQWWYDTTNNKLYIRNEANNAWIEVAVLDQTNNEWQISTGVIQAKDSDGLALKTDDGTTRLFIQDTDGAIGIGTTSPSYPLHISSTSSSNARLLLEATSAAAADGPILDLYRNSSSPAADDNIGIIYFSGEDDAGNKHQYARMDAFIENATSGSEDGRLTIQLVSGGSNKQFLGMRADTGGADGEVVINESQHDIDFRVESNSTTNLFVADASNARIGIGVNPPSSQLHIKAGSNDTAGGIRLESNDGSYYATIDMNDSGNFRFYQGTSARARFNADGHFLVGKTTTTRTDEGHQFNTNGFARHGADGDKSLELVRTNSDGEMMEFFRDSTLRGSMGVFSDRVYLAVPGHGISLDASGNSVLPSTDLGANQDNVVDIGASSARFDDVFATNGTIQTSDEREKQQIASLTDAEMIAAKAISKLFKTFKWNDAVTEKGDSARTHTGVIAQQVETAMSDAGLNAGNYAFFISDTWWETQTEVAAVEAVDEQLDDDGNVIVEAKEAKDAYTEVMTYPTQEAAPEGATERNRKGIRYPELLSFIGAATEQRLTSIEARLDALEG